MRAACRRLIPVFSLLAWVSCAARAESALVINLTAAPGMDSNAIAGFQAAADYWQSVLLDDVTVNINIDYTTLDPFVLGQAGSRTDQVSVSEYFTALNGDSTSADDAAAVANLPSLTDGFYLEFRTQTNNEGGSATISLDNDQSANNAFLDINTANLKALDLYQGSPVAADADITFSDEFTWDFDPTDGITAGAFDFVGVAIHEIGHALGFVSGVDYVDYFTAFPLDEFGNPIDLDEYAVFSGLDMFRYSSNDGVLDLATGANAYFSLDGGQTNLGSFSTGTFYGDGFQASHWKDNLGLGIMDPTANFPGQINTVSELDLRAFDVIGWDRVFDEEPVPEPSIMMLLGLCGLAYGVRTRRKNLQTAV